MEFNVIDFSDKDKWKEIVKDKEIYYQWEYVDAFYKNGDGKPFLAYAKNNSNYVFNVYFKRDIAEEEMFKEKIATNLFFDISTPYGYGGVEIVGDKDDELLNYFFSKFEEYCNANNIVSEFVRLNPLSNNHVLYQNTDYEVNAISKTVYIDLESEEKIWTEMKSTCRNRIRKAKKLGLEVKSGFNEKMMYEFIDIYRETMSRDNATKYYFFNKDFFNSIYDDMKNNATIYTVYLEEKAIDSILVIYNGQNAHYHLGGTLSEYMKVGAHNLSLYEAAKDMYFKGYKKFHLGGGYGGDDSPLLRFKKTFNKEGEMLDFCIAKRIFNSELYYKLIKVRLEDEEFDNESKFFPLYRSV